MQEITHDHSLMPTVRTCYSVRGRLIVVDGCDYREKVFRREVGKATQETCTVPLEVIAEEGKYFGVAANF